MNKNTFGPGRKYQFPFLLLLSAILGIAMTSCYDTPDYQDNPYDNYDALARIVGDRYCFFSEKDIDWEEVCRKHRADITPDTKTLELFDIMSALLDELQDGHVNLSSRFNTSYYRNWWSDYPQDFNLRTLQQYYLDFDYMQTSGISYKMMLPDSIGYMYYPSFSTPISESSLDYILAILYKSKGLIIDIRNNGGGLLTNINTLVGRFITEKTPGGFIRHKTGSGHNDFSEPYAIEYEPASDLRIKYFKPIAVLTNRSCFSAANDFVSVMQYLPNVKIIGAKTGGGGGLPFSSEIPNGWAVRFSACPINDRYDRVTEFGIDPTPGYEMHSPDEELAEGKDRILEFAIETLAKEAAEAEKSSE